MGQKQSCQPIGFTTPKKHSFVGRIHNDNDGVEVEVEDDEVNFQKTTTVSEAIATRAHEAESDGRMIDVDQDDNHGSLSVAQRTTKKVTRRIAKRAREAESEGKMIYIDHDDNDGTLATTSRSVVQKTTTFSQASVAVRAREAELDGRMICIDQDDNDDGSQSTNSRPRSTGEQVNSVTILRLICRDQSCQ